LTSCAPTGATPCAIAHFDAGWCFCRRASGAGASRAAPQPTLQFQLETLEATMGHAGVIGIVLEMLRERAIAGGFEFLSTLIEDRLRDTGPSWFRQAAVLERIDNYLRSGSGFAYLQVALN
jgi:hypothetical protein